MKLHKHLGIYEIEGRYYYSVIYTDLRWYFLDRNIVTLPSSIANKGKLIGDLL